MTVEKHSGIIRGIVDRPLETVSDEDKKALIMAVEGTFDTLFTWNYEQGEHVPIEALYKKAKTSQWDSDLDIDWSVGGQIDRARAPICADPTCRQDAELSVARERTEELWIFVWNGLELIGIRKRFPMIRNIRPSL